MKLINSHMTHLGNPTREGENMPSHMVDKTRVFFRQSSLPRQWMRGMYLLGVTVTVTGDRRYPYSVELSESDFLAVIMLIKEM